MPTAIVMASRAPGARTAGALSSPTEAGPGPQGRPPGPARRVEVDQAEQPRAEGDRQDRTVSQHGTDFAVTQPGVDRFPRVREHVPEQEDQDARGRAVEERLRARQFRPQPAEREAEEDGQPRDGAEQGDLGGRHGVLLKVSRRTRPADRNSGKAALKEVRQTLPSEVDENESAARARFAEGKSL
jgi:hypothetical protein